MYLKRQMHDVNEDLDKQTLQNVQRTNVEILLLCWGFF